MMVTAKKGMVEVDKAYRALIHEGMVLLNNVLLDADRRIKQGDYKGAAAILAALSGAVQQQEVMVSRAETLLREPQDIAASEGNTANHDEAASNE